MCVCESFIWCIPYSKDQHRAVQDFSIALLIGNSDTKSALAYLHRGVVYSQLKRYAKTSMYNDHNELMIIRSMGC